MAARKGGSRERLLDAAEQVFAEKGYDLATTRAIVARAGDTLGTLAYHFKSKEALLTEVVGRRSEELHQRRRAMYQEFKAKRDGGAPDVAEAITAIVEPIMRLALSRKPYWNDYMVILGRMLNAATEDQERIAANLLDPISVELLAWMEEAAPAASQASVAFAYQFIIAAMFDSGIQAKSDRLKRITNGSVSAADVGALNDLLIPFLIAGSRAILNL